MGVRIGQSVFKAGKVIVTAGAWTGLFPAVQLSPIKIEPVLGQMILFRAEKGCKKLREENRRLRAENQMLEDNMGNLLCTREEEMKYNRVLNENITKLAEVNALMAGKLSVYEPIKKAESQPDETADTAAEE